MAHKKVTFQKMPKMIHNDLKESHPDQKPAHNDIKFGKEAKTNILVDTSTRTTLFIGGELTILSENLQNL